jgi:hypothetical protein
MKQRHPSSLRLSSPETKNNRETLGFYARGAADGSAWRETILVPCARVELITLTTTTRSIETPKLDSRPMNQKINHLSYP